MEYDRLSRLMKYIGIVQGPRPINFFFFKRQIKRESVRVTGVQKKLQRERRRQNQGREQRKLRGEWQVRDDTWCWTILTITEHVYYSVLFKIFLGPTLSTILVSLESSFNVHFHQGKLFVLHRFALKLRGYILW